MMYTFIMTDEEIRRILRKKRKRQLLKRRIIALFVAAVITIGGGFLAGRAIGNKTYADEIKIALAGPATNLVTAFMFAASWWFIPLPCWRRPGAGANGSSD